MKFRAWHFSQKKMYSCEELVKDQMTLLADGRFINVDSRDARGSEIYPLDHLLPILFTGLLDKNGVEIYEGDVIEVELDKERAFSNGRKDIFRLKVYYGSDASFHALRIGTDHELYCINFGGSAVRRFEVIGNIYQDSHLLNE